MSKRKYWNPGDLARVITRERVICPGVSGAGEPRLDQKSVVDVACSNFRRVNLNFYSTVNFLFASLLPKIINK
jgi:hypothetical protein